MPLRLLLLTAFLLPFLLPAFGQDKMLYQNGQEELVKVLEVSPDSVFFIGFSDSAQKKMVSTPKAAVFMITYQNGSKQVMKEPEIIGNNRSNDNYQEPAVLSESALYLQGQRDAKHFHNATGTYFGTLGPTLLLPLGGPILGLGAGVILTTARIPERKIVTPQPALKQHSSYLAGYQNQAKKKKLGNAAAGLGTGIVLLYAAIFSLFAL